jgi:TIR domain
MATPAGAAHRLFLSHAGVDGEAALRLARRLEACEEAQTHGLKVWIDKADLGAGGRWKDALQSALAKSTAFAVYVGSRGVV